MDNVDKKTQPLFRDILPDAKGPLVKVQLDPWFAEALDVVVRHCKKSMLDSKVHDEQLSDAVWAVECLIAVPMGKLRGLAHEVGKDPAKVHEAEEWGFQLFLESRLRALDAVCRPKVIEPTASIRSELRESTIAVQRRASQEASRLEQRAEHFRVSPHFDKPEHPKSK